MGRDPQTDALRNTASQAVRIAGKLQGRIDRAIELLESHADDPLAQSLLDVLEGRRDAD